MLFFCLINIWWFPILLYSWMESLRARNEIKTHTTRARKQSRIRDDDDGEDNFSVVEGGNCQMPREWVKIIPSDDSQCRFHGVTCVVGAELNSHFDLFGWRGRKENSEILMCASHHHRHIPIEHKNFLTLSLLPPLAFAFYTFLHVCSRLLLLLFCCSTLHSPWTVAKAAQNSLIFYFSSLLLPFYFHFF